MHIKAQATQLRFKLRLIRARLGKYLARIYLEAYATPSILHGAELGVIPNAKLNTYHAWALSEVLGVGRGGRAEGLIEGEIRELCVFSDYSGPTWSQIRAKNAMVTYRSILRMGDHTLPKQCLNKLTASNILVDNILKRLGGGKATQEENVRKIKACKALNTTKPAMKTRWKQQVKKVQRREYILWIEEMTLKLQKDVRSRDAMTPEKRLMALGSGTAYLMALNKRIQSLPSVSHIDSLVPAKLKVKIRCLKAGLIPHMRVLKYMYNMKWHKMDMPEKKKAVDCSCGGGIQDVRHMALECHLTCHLHLRLKTAVETRLFALLTARKIELEDYTTLMELSEHEVLLTALHLPAPMTPAQRLITETYAGAVTEYLECMVVILAGET